MIKELSIVACLLVSGTASAQQTGKKTDPVSKPGAAAPMPAYSPPPLVVGEQALKGLRSVDLRLDIEQTGVDTVTLRNHLELRLRQAGLLVVPEATSTLRVDCLAVGDTPGVIGYSCGTAFQDVVTRYEPRAERFFAILWEGHRSVGRVGSATLESTIGVVIDARIDEFLNLWLKMNPR
jgi:hypothetical protein